MVKTSFLGGGNDALQLIANLATDRAVERRMRAIGLAVDHRRARIGGRANRHMQWNFAQKRHPKPLGLLARAAVAEDVRAGPAIRALKIAHVFDYAENRYI